MTHFPRLRAVYAFHDRHCVMVIGDEPDHHRTYGVVPTCQNMANTNVADLFAAAPHLLDLLDEPATFWGGEFASDNPIDGGDLVEWFAAWLPKVRTAIAPLREQQAEAAD